MTPTPDTAIILSAGLGRRMGTLCAHRPKPLVPVAGRTLIDRIMDRLQDYGIRRTVINVHYLADQLVSHFQKQIDDGQVLISDESEELLETGGGVVKALPLLGKKSFFAINSDALWTDAISTDASSTALGRLANAFDEGLMDCLMLLVPREKAIGYDGAGDFFRDQDTGQLSPRGQAETAPYVFAGVQILSPKAIAGRKQERFSNSIVFRESAAKGRLYGIVHNGDWMHVGSPENLRQAEAHLRSIAVP